MSSLNPSFASGLTGLPWKNKSTTTAPPHAVVAVFAHEHDDARIAVILHGRRPTAEDAADQTTFLVLNGPTQVDPEGVGTCYLATHHPAWAAIDPVAISPADIPNGSFAYTFGPEADKWTAKLGADGYTYVAHRVEGAAFYGDRVLVYRKTGDHQFRMLITEANEDDSPVAIYRTSHPSGFEARRCDASGTPTADPETIYATLDNVRGVFMTGDIVLCDLVEGKIQVMESGENGWTGYATENISADSTGDVSLYYTGDELIGPVVVTALNWSSTQPIPQDTIDVRVEWDNRGQRFLIVDPKCLEA